MGVALQNLKHILIITVLIRLSAPKENSTNLEFSTCDIRPPQKKSYDGVNGLALLLTSNDLYQQKGRSIQQHHRTSSADDMCHTSKIQGCLNFHLVLKACLNCFMFQYVYFQHKWTYIRENFNRTHFCYYDIFVE